jgi:hypothetical protein
MFFYCGPTPEKGVKIMKRILMGCAALPCLVNIAMAGQPMTLNDAQMETVTAGGTANVAAFATGDVSVSGTYLLNVSPNAGSAIIAATITPLGPSFVSLSATASSN